MIADEDAYGDMPDLHVRIVDTCPSGGGVTTIQTAARYAGRWRIRLDNPGSQIHGRCLEARITADSTDGPVNIWAGDYYFSNDVALHFAD